MLYVYADIFLTVESFKADVQHVAPYHPGPYAFQGRIKKVRSGVKLKGCHSI